MAEQIKPHPYIIDIPKSICRFRDKTKYCAYTRGTDGSQLSFKGLPTPNILQDVETSMAHLNMLLSM